MQLKKMRITEAKEYVADKLHVTPLDLSDPTVMFDVRKESQATLDMYGPGAVARGARRHTP